MTDFYEIILAPPLGLRIDWRDGAIRRMGLAWAKDLSEEHVETPEGQALAEALRRYVQGRPAAWPDLPLDRRDLTPFTRRVLEELQRIGPGRTVTYAGLAARCGRPGAARAVGRVMASNRFPLLYPCHRVLASGGLGGFGPGLDMKRWLLDLEGAG